MKKEATIHRDPVAARQALRAFLHPSCREQRFIYESPDSRPVENCLCWHEYQTPLGVVTASLRYSLLSVAYSQPFSFWKRIVLKLFGAAIDTSVYLSPEIFVDPLFPSLITIEEGTLLGVGARIALHEHGGTRFVAGRVHIGKRVTIGANAKIACGVTIGDDAIVGLGAVVLKDVPPKSVVIGNPARLAKTEE